ncbi:hydrogenase expression/formation protein [Rhodospirillum rubrum]|uniref:HyaD/HybD family hydrogenase maturation endopeptidase n=1 Tax=Rhodospirillum rubrum TaxID=1085 RepID=UPI001908F78A|nr:HyaD/HybD family hydrogenase maturation endopeptidase [Rhodospirillum rubrum]MBK1664272.1 hydrogenase expression/formation protein [Rhodospirillum rubrum]MBK1675933.1 hydrogenase expression/formation protein [Rhodospirillum rubrum]
MIGPGGLPLAGEEDEEDCAALVLGIGNLLWADEGFGVRCVEEMHATFDPAPGVRLLDGGTQGLYLVGAIARAARLIVFDAIDYGEAPGTLKVVFGEEVAGFMGCRKMSLHQTGFQDVLAAADLLGRRPAVMALIGVQAEALDDWGGPLRPVVRAQVGPAIAQACALLAEWGLACRPRPAAPAGGLLGFGLSSAAYEQR